MATHRQRSISCSDENWRTIQGRAKDKGLSVSEYLLALSDASDAEDGAETSVKLLHSNDERSMHRAIWFLYADRLTELKDADKQDRVDQLIAEARRKFE